MLQAWLRAAAGRTFVDKVLLLLTLLLLHSCCCASCCLPRIPVSRCNICSRVIRRPFAAHCRAAVRSRARCRLQGADGCCSRRAAAKGVSAGHQ